MSVDVTGQPAPYGAMDAVPTEVPASVPGTPGSAVSDEAMRAAAQRRVADAARELCDELRLERCPGCSFGTREAHKQLDAALDALPEARR